MIGEHWTPGGDVLTRLRRLLNEVLDLATAATLDAADDDDFEGVLGAEDRELVATSIGGLTEELDRAVDHQLDGEPFEVVMVGYREARPPGIVPSGPSLGEQIDRLRSAGDRWWTSVDRLGLRGADLVPHPDREGMRIDDLALDLVESAAVAVGEVTALLERRR